MPFSLPVSGVTCINNRNVILCFESIFNPLFNETNIVQIHRLNMTIFLFLIFLLVWNIWLSFYGIFIMHRYRWTIYKPIVFWKIMISIVLVHWLGSSFLNVSFKINTSIIIDWNLLRYSDREKFTERDKSLKLGILKSLLHLLNKY